MRTRRLGNHIVTVIGGGDLCLATSAARGVHASDVERALHEAIELGITLFDVASDADSERLAGHAVRAQRARDRVVLATRVPSLATGASALATGVATAAPTARRDTLADRLPAPYVQHRIEDALRATRLDALPFVQLPLQPAWLASSAWPELVGAAARLVREGKVLAWGLWLDELPDKLLAPTDDDAPAHNPALTADVAALIAEPWLASLSVIYHLCDRRAEPLLDAAAKRDLAILARQPLAGGALTGALGPGVTLSQRDDRRSLDTAALERVAVAVARLAPLVEHEPPAARSCAAARAVRERATRPDHVECHDVADLALRFAIDRAGIALPRLHRREHVGAAIAAAAAPALSASLVARVVDEIPPAPP